jgi:hypothetical protein
VDLPPRDRGAGRELAAAGHRGGKVRRPHEDIEILPGKVISGTRAIESDATCRAFELVWLSYVSYSVRNESFCTLDKEERWEGRLFCLYSKSHFLDYVAQATFASADYPGPLQHWGVNCLNHIVDVVSIAEPQVREIKHAERVAAADGGGR